MIPLSQLQPRPELTPAPQPLVILPFSISIYTKEEPVYRYLSASMLRSFLNKIFSLQSRFNSKNIFCVQIKYTVEKNQKIIKLSESLKSSPFIIDTKYNRIDGSDFMRMIFADCDKIIKKAPNENMSEIISQKPKVQNDECDKFENAMIKFMRIYNSTGDSNFEYVKSSDVCKEEVEKIREEIKITGLVRMKQRDYSSVFENFPFKPETTSNSPRQPEFFIRTIGGGQLRKSRQGKETQTIESWKAGIIHGNNFVPFFDNGKLLEKLVQRNSSIKVLKSGLIKEIETRNKKFEIYTCYYEGLIIKLEFKKVHISAIYKRKENDEIIYYVKMDFPPRFYAAIQDSKLDQQIGYINTWKRIQNFTLIDHDKIRDNQLLRLHLFNNTVIRIETKEKTNKKSILFFQQLYNEFETRSQIATFTQNKNISIEYICTQVDYRGFSKKLSSISSLTVEDRIKSEEIRWNLNYLILCLMSKGLLTAFQAIKVIDFIESKQNYKVFIYVFDKMYESQNGQGIDYVIDKYEEYKTLSEDLMVTQYDDDSLAAKVWRVQITPSGYLYGNKAPEMKNRIQREYKQEFDHFMRASVLDDDGSEIKNQLFLSKKVYRKLIAGFQVLNRKYIPLGWSPSQLRSFSLWYIHEIHIENKLVRSQVLDFLGKFQNIFPPAKMAARIGQAFSSSWNPDIRDMEKIKVEMIPDIFAQNTKISKDLLFTDGIGKVSENIMKKIALKLKLHQDLGAIQVRYLGNKGVLVLDKQLPKNTVQIRPSMKKYECSHPNARKYLDILDWNKFKAGFLNRQIIILLRSRGIKNQVFLSLQNDYIQDIQSLTYKECSIFKELVNDEHNENLFNLDPANKIIMNLIEAGFNLDEEPFFRGVMQILKRNGYEKLKEKSNINVAKSARLIGIIDEYKVLKENEVYCRIIDPFDKQHNGEARTINSQVIVVRNPCLHPADIRKLTAVSQETIIQLFGKQDHPFKDYPNTVIMTQNGDTPITSAISGSDLDGDNFWICWDENLIGVTDQDPFVHIDHSEKKKQQKKQRNTVDQQCYDEMLDFFCDYMNYDLLGKIANSHLIKSDQNLIKFSYDEKCLELAVAHGHAVDFPKTGHRPNINQELIQVSEYPDFLEKEEEKTYQSQSILGILYRGVKEKIEAPIIQDRNRDKPGGISEYFDNDLIINNPKGIFPLESLKQTLQILYIFSQDMSRIIYLANLQNQFQIYTGNVTAKTKGKPKKNKGFKHNKLMEQIVLQKQKFQKLFFSKVQKGEEYLSKYRQSEKNNLGSVFSEEILTKASLWYLVSYAEYFKEKIAGKSEEFDKNFRAQIVEAKKGLSLGLREVNQLGLVWFAIPKVMMEIKMRAIVRRKEEERQMLLRPRGEEEVGNVENKGDESKIEESRIEQSKVDESKFEESRIEGSLEAEKSAQNGNISSEAGQTKE